MVNVVQRLRASLCLALLLGLTTQAALALTAGDPIPDFRLPGLLAKGELSRKHLLGRVIYLDFWASWCGPCRKSMPALDELYRQFGDQGFAVVAINLDESEGEARDFLMRFPVSYPVLKDDGRSFVRFALTGLPQGYLLDRQGRVTAVHKGFQQGDERLLKNQIVRLLKEGS